MFQYSQQFSTGTSGAFTFVNTRSLLNSSTPLFNPSISGYFDVQVNQNTPPRLQSFDPTTSVIRVAKNNLKVSNLQVKLQVVTTVSAVLNLYWDLVSFNEAMRIKEQALETAQKLYDGNQKQVQIGALPAIEVTRAAAEVSASKEDLLIAQTNVAQQEIVLKNALNRNSMQNVWLDDVHIIPLDHIEVPKTEEIRPISDLIQEAIESRLEVERGKVNLDSSKILLKGDKNGLIPNLQAFAELDQSRPRRPPPIALQQLLRQRRTTIFIGGNGNVLAQIFRRSNFPDYLRRLLPQHPLPQSRRRRPISSPTNSSCAKPNSSSSAPSTRCAST